MAKALKTQPAFRSWLPKASKVHALHKGIGYRQALEEAREKRFRTMLDRMAKGERMGILPKKPPADYL